MAEEKLLPKIVMPQVNRGQAELAASFRKQTGADDSDPEETPEQKKLRRAKEAAEAAAKAKTAKKDPGLVDVLAKKLGSIWGGESLADVATRTTQSIKDKK